MVRPAGPSVMAAEAGRHARPVIGGGKLAVEIDPEAEAELNQDNHEYE
jgi:hypothetical protein